MQQNSLIKDTFFYSIANWGGRFVAFIVTPLIIAYFSPEENGFFNIINSSVIFLMSIALLGVIDQGFPFFFTKTEDLLEKKQYASSAFLLSIIGILSTSVLLLLFTPLVPHIFNDIKNSLLFTSLIFILLITKCYSYIGSNLLKWTYQSPLFTKITLFQTATIGLFSVLGILFFHWRVTEILICTALISLFSGIWAHLSVKSFISFKYTQKDKIKEILIYSWPLLGMNISATLMKLIDRYFIGNINGMADVGIFSVAANVSSVFDALVMGFFFAWGPFLLSTYKNENSPKKYAHYYSFFIALGLISIFSLGFWGENLIKLIRPSGEYKQIGIFIPWILSGSILLYAGGNFTPGPYLMKKNQWKLYTTVFGALLNMGLNYVLVNSMGILGACIATFTSMLVIGVINQILSNKLYYVPNRWKLSAILISLACFIVSFIQSDLCFFNINLLPFMVKITATFILSFLFVLPFVKDIKDSHIIDGIYNKFSKRLKK